MADKMDSLQSYTVKRRQLYDSLEAKLKRMKVENR